MFYNLDRWTNTQESAEALLVLAAVDRVEGDYAASDNHLAEALKLSHAIACDFEALKIIIGYVELYAAEKKMGRAVALAALAQQHPKALAASKDQAARLLETLKTQLPADDFNAAMERGQKLQLDRLIGELVGE